MDPNTFPTKGNLILAKNSLKLAHMGYELMDKKRNILIRELMGLIDEAKDIQRQIDVTFREAYAALQIANMEIGITQRTDRVLYRSGGGIHPDQDKEYHGRGNSAGRG